MNMNDYQLLSGNEAIALGALDGGATIGTGYPGTPSTETLEAYANFDNTYAEWCTNEKVALEVAIGASAAGAKTLTTMKHVGLNVAADPLFTAAYTGVGAGMVVLVADDPGMHSSQNEQDTRYYGAAAKVPILEPSNSQEAYDMAKLAYSLSEQFDVPIIIRTSVRVSHTKTPVLATGATVSNTYSYEKNPSKWVMMPAFARTRRLVQLERISELENFAATTSLNKIEIRDTSIGIITSGAAYEHVREALPDASTLKLGITWPLSTKLLADFKSKVDKLYVIEEASTFLHDAVTSCGISVDNTPFEITKAGELDPKQVFQAFYGDSDSSDELLDTQNIDPQNLPPRPPSLCPGCPHRVVFKELTRQKAIVTGDIGCYTLGALAPLSAIDTCVCMGASVSMAHGMQLAFKDTEQHPVVAVIGDSTFAHSGIESLASTAFNGGAGTICILDNRTTAMTGRQGNPFNGDILDNKINSRELDLEKVAYSLGADKVSTVNPNDVTSTRLAIKEAVSDKNSLDVIIFKSPCVLLNKTRDIPYGVSGCTGCGVCISIGCPAIGKDADSGLAYIDKDACIGCGQCAQYCKFSAIVR